MESYPHIPNLIHLYKGGGMGGLRRVCERLSEFRDVFVAEKVDGVNVSIRLESGVPVLRSRGGRILKERERGPEFGWLLSHFHRWRDFYSSKLCSDHVIFLEYVPPPEVKPDYLMLSYGRPFIAFLDLSVSGRFIPYDWASIMVGWLREAGIEFIEHRRLEEVGCETLLGLLREIKRRKRSDFGDTRIEGFVVKAYSPGGHFYVKLKDEDLPILEALKARR